jgi:hypothetical protein
MAEKTYEELKKELDEIIGRWLNAKNKKEIIKCFYEVQRNQLKIKKLLDKENAKEKRKSNLS